jgi:DNA primase
VCFGAARGSHLSPAHASKFATFQEVVACADPDKAGKSYAEALRAALGRWTRFRVVEVPPGFDPAKLERRRGPAALAELLRLPRAAA